MSIDNLQDLLQEVMAIAKQAAEQILSIYGTEFQVDTKADQSPLTAADMAAHQCIVNGLNKISTLPILSEESADIPYTERSQWQRYWLVDPLDGTKEFIKRNGDFTVNIALIDVHKPILGVVYVPVTRQCYYAAESIGAYKQTDSQAAQSITVRQKISTPLTVAGSKSHKTPELADYLSKLPEHDLISIGSSLKLCLVAEGSADLYPRIGLTSEWDTAAAQCIVEQAGGAVTEVNGLALEYNRKDSLLNPYFLVFGDQSHDWTQYAK